MFYLNPLQKMKSARLDPLNLFVQLAKFYESKFKFIAVTNKKTVNKSVIYHISPSEIDKKSIIRV